MPDTEPTTSSQPKLLFRSGLLRGQVLALEKDRVSIGRDAKNDIAIADGIVSSFHAAILRDEAGEFWLEDAGSKNGTFLNGERVEREPLRDGDVFHLCQAGPEVQFVLGTPRLPGIIESTTSTFTRTKSLGQAFRELLPGGKAGLSTILRLTGVRRIVDYQLEEVVRRTRSRSLTTIAAILLLSTIGLVTAVVLQRSGGGPAGTGLVSAPAAGPALSLDAKLDPIYGSLFLAYRDQAIGFVDVGNRSAEPVTDVEVGFRFADPHASFLVESYSMPIPRLAPGETARVKLLPKLSTMVLSDTTREVTAVVSASVQGRTIAETNRAVFIHGRHVFGWEEPERIAAFIDPEDPVVVEFVHSVWKHRPEVARQEFPPPNVVGALTLLTGLAELGLRYLPDRAHPLSARIDSKATDEVKYPGETLLARAGDCDDLSVLSCAVLECAGIPTAFAVGAGHVFFLFDTGIRASTLSDTPLDPVTVIVRGERVWMPVEATDFARPGANFSSAWSATWARCESILSGETKVIEIREAARKYHPMNPELDSRAKEKIASATWVRDGFDTSLSFGMSSLAKLFQENLAAKLSEIDRASEGLEREQAKAILYARSGLYEEARKTLERAIFESATPPTLEALKASAPSLGEEKAILLVNLVMCMSLGARSAGDLDTAAGYGEAALSAVPEAPPREKGELMLRVALVHRLRGDLSAERSWSGKAFAAEPDLKATYERVVATEGTVAGPEEKVFEYLARGLR